MVNYFRPALRHYLSRRFYELVISFAQLVLRRYVEAALDCRSRSDRFDPARQMFEVTAGTDGDIPHLLTR